MIVPSSLGVPELDNAPAGGTEAQGATSPGDAMGGIITDHRAAARDPGSTPTMAKKDARDNADEEAGSSGNGNDTTTKKKLLAIIHQSSRSPRSHPTAAAVSDNYEQTQQLVEIQQRYTPRLNDAEQSRQNNNDQASPAPSANASSLIAGWIAGLIASLIVWWLDSWLKSWLDRWLVGLIAGLIGSAAMGSAVNHRSNTIAPH